MTCEKQLTRRCFLRYAGIGASAVAIAACQPKTAETVVKETVAKVEKVAVETAAPAPAAEGAIAITIMMFSGELSPEQLDQFAADNAPITLSRLEPDQVKFYAMLASGTPPDIYRTQAPEFPQLLNKGIVLNLQPYFENSKYLKLADLFPSNYYYRASSPLAVGEGDQYGITKDWSPDLTIWIDTAAFEAAGVPVPSDKEPMTYDDVASLAQKLTKKEGDRLLVVGFGNGLNWIDRYWEVWLESMGQSLHSDDFTKFTLRDNPDAMECVKWHFDLSKELYMQCPFNPSPRNNIGSDYLAGELAMLQFGFWFSGRVSGAAASEGMAEGHKAMMLPAPVWKSGKRLSPTITATGTVIPKGVKNADAAWTGFEWYNGREPATQRAKSGWGVPALKSLAPLIPAEGELRQQVRAVLDGELQYADHVIRFNPYLKGGEPAAIGQAFHNYWQRAYNGEFTFEEMVDNIQKDIDMALEEGVASTS